MFLKCFFVSFFRISFSWHTYSKSTKTFYFQKLQVIEFRIKFNISTSNIIPLFHLFFFFFPILKIYRHERLTFIFRFVSPSCCEKCKWYIYLRLTENTLLLCSIRLNVPSLRFERDPKISTFTKITISTFKFHFEVFFLKIEFFHFIIF